MTTFKAQGIFALIFLLSLGLSQTVKAQDISTNQSFKQYQLSAPRVQKAYQENIPYWKNLFRQKHFSWPPKHLLFRAFKASNTFEIWVKDNNVDTYRFLKEFPICALSGRLGPKRFQGDEQVPEGYYFISEFNTHSAFDLSLKLNYPNYSDLVKGNKSQPGGNIYIHGGCVTIGCLPMTNKIIEKIYPLALVAKINGQNNIPVHIFPIRFEDNTIKFLSKNYRLPRKQRFWLSLKAGYDYFKKHHTIFPVMYNKNGDYIY